MRMSRRDIRDETKQQEGDPHIRARLRQIRLERSRKRMMQNVPKSTVVITNPTHYSVALRYDAGEPTRRRCAWPRGWTTSPCASARRRRSTTSRSSRTWRSPARCSRLGGARAESVPREHFEAVAKVIGFVMNTAKGRKR